MENVIGLACDHAGFEMKEFLAGFLMAAGYAVKDYGTHSTASVDYPVYGHAMAEGCKKGEFNLGIALCGSANGISMVLNRHKGVRAAICWQPELACLARAHNNANVCSLPARFIDNVLAVEIVEKFLSTPFEGERHERRIEMF